MLSILIDSREPDWVTTLKFNNALTLVTLLQTGDMQIIGQDGQLLVIERKTPDDLLNSIRDDRLFEQVTRMRQLSPWCYLVITGLLQPTPDGKVNTGNRVTGWDYNAVQGALLTVQELGCSVYNAKSDYDYGPAVERLIARSREQLRVGASRGSNILTPGEVMLTALPGIGLDRAQQLIKACGSAAAALAWLTGQTGESIPGIGPATRATVKKALGMTDNEVMVVLTELDRQVLGMDYLDKAEVKNV